MDVEDAKWRSFAFFRTARDRMLAWVSREAPIIAARLHVDEGALWRAMMGEMRKLLAELAAVDTEQALLP